MNNLLDKIIEQKKHELKHKKFYFPLTKFIKNIDKSQRNLKSILKTGDYLHLIGELKKASPLEGSIEKNFATLKIAKTCQDYLDALLIVTEEKFFHGNIGELKEINQFSKIPLIQKDFIIDEYQIYEARSSGADAILLFSCLLNNEQIKTFLSLAKQYKMDCLVEIHTLEELQRILGLETEIISINNRDWKTFDLDMETLSRLTPHVPEDKIIISDSGLKTKKNLGVIKANAKGMILDSHILKSQHLVSCLKNWQAVCRKPLNKAEKNKQLSLV